MSSLSIGFRPFACFLWALTALASAAWAADPVLPGWQTTPGRLDPSLAHESRAALDRGLAWLAARQNPDGGWAATNRPELTALPFLAFTASPDPAHREIRERADACLSRLAPPPLRAADWSMLLLTQAVARAGSVSSNTVGSLLFGRLAAGAGLRDPAVQKAYAWIAAHPELFSPATWTRADYADRLFLAMALAQSGKNRLPMADHSLLAWRPRIARALINRQKTDPETGGLFWTADGSADPAETLAATCYALLTLQVALAE